jgi:hypothetical protein
MRRKFIMNDEQSKALKAVVTYFKVPFQHFIGGIVKNWDKPRAG